MVSKSRYFLWFLRGVILLWVLLVVGSAIGLGWSLTRMKAGFQKQNVVMLHQSSAQAQGFQQALGLLLPGIHRVPYAGEIYLTSKDGIGLALHSTSLIQGWSEVNPLSGQIPEALLLDTQQQIHELVPALQTFRDDLSAPRFKKVAKLMKQEEQLENLIGEIERFGELSPAFLGFVDQLPSILGFHGKQHYIVLLQNNMELRPTGGFMGSFANFWMNQGAVTDLRIEDIYVPDGQIKGYVKEPDPIREYLFNKDHPGWRLRDSNWDPDFPKTKKAIEWFFTEGNMEPVDGMVALNLIPVLDIVRSLGPIDVPDYQVALTQDNFYLETQRFVETDFFPGSTQKRDFLGMAGKALLTRIGNEPQTMRALLPIIVKNLQKGQILVSFDNQPAHAFMEAIHWSGSLSSAQCPPSQPNCIPDYVYWNEANLGINKTNCCVIRTFRDEITVGSDRVSHTWTLNYANNNPGTPAPPLHFGGGYKNYMRLYVPKDTIFEDIEINGKLLEASDIDVEEAGENTNIGFLNLTQGGETSTIIVKYHRPVENNANSPYVLTMQKQSGIDSIPLEIQLKREGEEGYTDVTQKDFQLMGFKQWEVR